MGNLDLVSLDTLISQKAKIVGNLCSVQEISPNEESCFQGLIDIVDLASCNPDVLDLADLSFNYN